MLHAFLRPGPSLPLQVTLTTYEDTRQLDLDTRCKCGTWYHSHVGALGMDLPSEIISKYRHKPFELKSAFLPQASRFLWNKPMEKFRILGFVTDCFISYPCNHVCTISSRYCHWQRYNFQPKSENKPTGCQIVKLKTCSIVYLRLIYIHIYSLRFQIISCFDFLVHRIYYVSRHPLYLDA